MSTSRNPKPTIVAIALLLLWIAAMPALAAQTQYPFTFQDVLGREVVLTEAPKRIVSVGPSNTEILFAIGASDLVVGVDRFSNYPPEAGSLPQVGGLTSPSMDAIVALLPDLVILSISSSPEHAARLESFGITTAMLAPGTLNEVVEAVDLVGVMTNRQEDAGRLAESLRARIDAVKSVVAEIPAGQRVRAFFELWHDPLRSAGPGSFVHDLIGIAGGVNIAGDAETEWPIFSLEVFVARDPQVIITGNNASYQEIRQGQRAQWAGVSAVKEGRITLIDGDVLARTGPRAVDALELMAKAFHPDRFGR